MNAFERSGRLAKVAKLVAAIDAGLVAMNVHPFSVEAARAVADLTPAGWASAAKAAQVNEPSEATRALVVELYEGRPEHLRQAVREARRAIP